MEFSDFVSLGVVKRKPPETFRNSSKPNSILKPYLLNPTSGPDSKVSPSSSGGGSLLHEDWGLGFRCSGLRGVGLKKRGLGLYDMPTRGSV